MKFYCLRENRRISSVDAERCFESAREDYLFSRFHRLDIRPVRIYTETIEEEAEEMDFCLIHGVVPLFRNRLAEKIMELTDSDNLLVRRVVIETPDSKRVFYMLLPRAIDALDSGGKILEQRCGRYPIFKPEGRERDIVVNEELARTLCGAGNLRLELVQS